jgi:hypothetical protein
MRNDRVEVSLERMMVSLCCTKGWLITWAPDVAMGTSSFINRVAVTLSIRIRHGKEAGARKPDRVRESC